MPMQTGHAPALNEWTGRNDGSIFEEGDSVTDLQGDRTGSGTVANKSGRPRILLVHNDDSIRNNIHELFENDGYDVIAAQNGVDALTIFHTSLQPIDLL